MRVLVKRILRTVTRPIPRHGSKTVPQQAEGLSSLGRVSRNNLICNSARAVRLLKQEKKYIAVMARIENHNTALRKPQGVLHIVPDHAARVRLDGQEVHQLLEDIGEQIDASTTQE